VRRVDLFNAAAGLIDEYRLFVTGAGTSAQRAACASSHRSTAPLASSTAASGVAP
jgi:hypothetical protein